MLRLLVVVVLDVLLRHVAGFNLDTSHPVVLEGNQSGSYFGYTVALRDLGAGGYRLVVGAPRGNSSFPKHQSLDEPGVVYQCNIQAKTCQQFALDLTGNLKHSLANGVSYKDRKENGWVGGSIAVQQSPRSPMVVCAPRWINNFHERYYFMNGICYLSKADEKPDSKAQIIYPLSGNNAGFELPKKPEENKTEVYYFAYGEAGISTHFTENGADLLIGAPGVFDWAGTIAVIQNVLTNGRLKIPNPFYTPDQERHGYFGYAVSSGKFFTRPAEASQTLYVSGAPRAGQLRGKVFVFGLPLQKAHSLDVRVEKVGEQLGEYFGSTLCVADVNADGLDDLLVGAPRYTLREPGRTSWDEGRVYVFLSKDQGILKEVTGDSKIVGDRVYGANFGTSIASIGDLNGDGYPDIAIGAPYGGKDGTGAIYIYHGYRAGIKSKYSQRILGSDINKSIRGFGISISNGMDIDNNYYNDVAVGAYISGHAVVLRTWPVVTLRAELTADVNRININATSFQVASCLSYSGKHVPSEISVRCNLVVETIQAIAYFSNSANNESNKHTEDIAVHIGISSCNNFTINLKHGEKDFSKPVDIKLDFSLQNNIVPMRKKRGTYDDFCKVCSVLDPDQPNTVTLRVPFATGCGEEDICRTDLRLEAELISAAVPLVLGNQSTVSLAIALENRLDPAFLAHVIIEAPRFLVLVRMPSSCHDESNPSLLRLDCDEGNPLTAKAGMRNITVELDVTKIPENTTELVFNVTATSAGQEQLPGDNQKLLTLNVSSLSDIRMTGISTQEMVYFRKAADRKDEEITFVHSYEVRNYGPSKVSSMQLTFRVPVAVLLAEKNITVIKLYPPKVSLAGQYFFCSASDYEFFMDTSSWSKDGGLEQDPSLPVLSRKRRWAQDEDTSANNATLFLNCSQEATICTTIVCNNVGPFWSVQASATAQLAMRVQLQELVSILDKRDIVLLSTSGSISYQRPPNSLQTPTKSVMKKSVVTVFKAEDVANGLKLWVLVLAIIAGLLLFLLLVLGLVKLGFFRRSKKEELDILKNKIELQYDDDDDDADQAL